MYYDYERLRSLIRERYKSVANFARALGVSRQCVCAKLDRGARFKPDKVKQIAALLDIPSNEIEYYFFKQRGTDVAIHAKLFKAPPREIERAIRNFYDTLGIIRSTCTKLFTVARCEEAEEELSHLETLSRKVVNNYAVFVNAGMTLHDAARAYYMPSHSDSSNIVQFPVRAEAKAE